MKSYHKLLWFGALVLLMGCVPSLHPFYTDKDLLFQPALVGNWMDTENPNNTWDFVKSNDTSYIITYTEDSTPGKFDGHFFKLGNQLYLDIYPQEIPKEIADQMNGYYKMHLIPTHTLLKITLSGDTMLMAAMDPDVFKKMSEAKTLTVKHEQDKDNNVILTASPLELQNFVKKNTKEIFGKPGVLVRKK